MTCAGSRADSNRCLRSGHVVRVRAPERHDESGLTTAAPCQWADRSRKGPDVA